MNNSKARNEKSVRESKMGLMSIKDSLSEYGEFLITSRIFYEINECGEHMLLKASFPVVIVSKDGSYYIEITNTPLKEQYADLKSLERFGIRYNKENNHFTFENTRFYLTFERQAQHIDDSQDGIVTFPFKIGNEIINEGNLCRLLYVPLCMSYVSYDNADKSELVVGILSTTMF